MPRQLFLPISVLIFFLIDWYVFQAVRTLTSNRIVHIAYWAISATIISLYLYYHLSDPDSIPKSVRILIMASVFIHYFSKIFALLFIFIDDIIRFFRWVFSLFQKKQATATLPSSSNELAEASPKITRSDFLMKTALVAGSIPALTMTWGILSGAHDYRIRRIKLRLPNLPKEYEGMKIGQLSDIHSGSFFNKTAVKGGIELFLNENPDVIFFTGDLVNNKANEVEEYQAIFSKIKAPLGVYSTLGNHDYGDYVQWESKQAKQQNLQNLITVHKQMGWDILLDEHRYLQVGNEKIALIGIQNWGAGERWPKYGNMQKAMQNIEEVPIKLLLSHDPSHWDAQVKKQHKDIDVMFAGHTHGMQFGIENELFRWSPSQYAYKQWAGLYEENNQKLYVNRGFGYLGYPGRVGILPEITIFELTKEKA